MIEVDGQQAGTVTGQAIYAIGDVYSLTTTSGNLVASETEELNAITHTATLYDWDNKETGRLEERVLALTPTVDTIHTNGGGNETVGTATTDLISFTHQTAITDNTGAQAWNTERHAFTLRTTITITRRADNSSVPGIDALMVTLMMSEIHDGASNK